MMREHYEAHVIYRDQEERDEISWTGPIGESAESAVKAAREQVALDPDREYLRIEVFHCEQISTVDMWGAIER